MAAFYVGQRVRVARTFSSDGPKIPGPVISIGDTGVVVGTRPRPNIGFWPDGECDISVLMDGYTECGMAPSWAFEPATPEGWRKVEWSECLWQPSGSTA